MSPAPYQVWSSRVRGGGVEPRQSCPFLKLESHFTLSIHIPAGNRFIQGPVWCWDDLKIVEFCLPQQD